MAAIKELDHLEPDDLSQLVTGYISNGKYAVSKSKTGQNYTFTLELVSLPQPYQKHYDHIDAETLASYQQVIQSGYSFGAYEGDACVGMIIAEPREWNRSVWVWELHVAESRRGSGIGRQLVEALAQKARTGGMRIVVCETQSTNLPAIHFYRQAGFELEAIDLSYYSNEDFPGGEIALFMKRRLS